MKHLINWLKKKADDHHYRQALRMYMERQLELHAGHYVLLAILLAVGSIVLQTIWFMYSLLK